jgi:hypothetical protein
MEIKLKYFLNDLIWLITEDYNESLELQSTASNDQERMFADGQNLAYFHVLD